MTTPTCAGADSEVFFPEHGDYTAAREYCEFCPVKDACLAQAMADERHVGRADTRAAGTARPTRRDQPTKGGDMKPYYEGDGIVLYHGDCREVTAWLEADVLVTDPPYGIGWTQKKGRYHAADRGGGKTQEIIRDAVVGDDDTSSRDWVLAQWDDRPAIVFGSWRVPRPPGTSHRLIWYKTKTAPGPRTAPWFPAEEEIYVIGSGFKGKPAQNVLTSDEIRWGATGAVAKAGHPTPKPVQIMESLVVKCPPGTIADPFAGSGSTLVAAKLQGRKAIGVELEERYCEIAARRLDQGVLEFPA
jgi:DNA modification methylase